MGVAPRAFFVAIHCQDGRANRERPGGSEPVAQILRNRLNRFQRRSSPAFTQTVVRLGSEMDLLFWQSRIKAAMSRPSCSVSSLEPGEDLQSHALK